MNHVVLALLRVGDGQHCEGKQDKEPSLGPH
uniref:Uncharacterized protein n=1 Tax=Arundo donax TaxID=35708 RepID=A0A0A9HDP8_ARUDO